VITINLQRPKRNKGLLTSLTLLFALSTWQTTASASSTGLQIGSSTDPYWFEISGDMKFDQTFFLSSDQFNEHTSGANARSISTSFDGGLGKNLSYSLTLSLEGNVNIDDAFITYKGFGKTNSISVGQVNSTFCLENANSSKWIPFLERSLPANAFSPCPGLGISWKTHLNPVTFKLVISQPKDGDRNTTAHGDDKVAIASRLLYAPIQTSDRVLHFGISTNVQDVRPVSPNGATLNDVRFSVAPEARSRRVTRLLDTGGMQASSFVTGGVEAATLLGPLLLQTEYMVAKVNRYNLESVNFKGWHATVSYVLTGEQRGYVAADGKFDKVIPNKSYGAWEVALRHSFLDLNDKDINGGREHNTSASLGCFVNENLRFIVNYVHASVRPSALTSSTAKRNLNILGARIQVAW